MELATAKAVITGGASGLGFATAQRVIDAGGQVVLLDINDELGEASAAPRLGDRASYIRSDVANEDSVKAAISAANEAMGGITLAVNCAGIATAGRTLGREGPWPPKCSTRSSRSISWAASISSRKPLRSWRKTTRTTTANAASSSARRQSPRSRARSDRPLTRHQKAASSA